MMKRLAHFIASFALACTPVLSYALDIVDFTNGASVSASSSEFELDLSNNDSSQVVIPKGLVVTKTANSSGLSMPPIAGEPIVYTITAENIGLLDLTNVLIGDTIIPAANISLISGDTDLDNEIDADEIWVYQGVYQLTQADLDSNGGGDGDIDNTAVIITDEIPNTEDSVEVPITQAPELTLTKSASPLTSATVAGDTITYSFSIENTGNVQINGVSPVDSGPTFDGAAPTNGLSVFSPLTADLAPGDAQVFTATYVLDQTDIDTMAAAADPLTAIDNTADATGTPVSGVLVSVPDTLETGFIPLPDAVDDSSTGNVPGDDTTLNLLTNDTLSDGGPATVANTTIELIDPATGLPTTTPGVVTVPGQGTWTLNPATGDLTFDPEPGFTTDPAPIDYILTETLTGLTDTATVTVAYAEVPPVAVDDESLGNLPEVNAIVDLLANDTLSDGTPITDPATQVTIDLDPLTAGVQNTLVVAGQGTWTVDPATGILTFDPEPGFALDPTPVNYELTETQTGMSDTAMVTIVYDPPAPLVALTKTLNALSPVDLGNGSFEITYDMEAENLGNIALNLQIEDSLVDMVNTPHPNNATFSSPVVSSATLTPNPAYDGDGDINMLAGSDVLQVGEVATLSVTFTFTPDVYFGPFDNNAMVVGTPNVGPVTQDTGGDGFVLALDATTPITLGWFKASEFGVGEVLLEWITEAEVANAGFYLWSEDADGKRQQLNTDMIVSQGDSLSTQHYEYLATGISDKVFMISDVAVTGNELEHGPFQLNTAYGAKTKRKVIDWDVIQGETERKQQLRDQQRQQELKRQLEQIQGSIVPDMAPITQLPGSLSSFGKVLSFVMSTMIAPVEAIELLNFEVEKPGIYRVSHADILAAGVDLSGMSVNRIGLKDIELVPIKLEPAEGTFEAGSFIEFTGRGVDTLYSGTNKYTLVLDEGQTLIVDDNRLIPDGPVAYSYLAEQTYAPQTSYSQHSPDLEDSWYADRLTAITGPAEKTVVLTVDDHAPVFSSPGGSASNGAQIAAQKPALDVVLWGASALPGNGNTDPDHHVTIDVNGVQVVDDRFDGLRVRQINQPLGQIIDGGNSIKVNLPKDHGYPFDIMNIDRISILYPRRFNAEEEGTTLVFDASWNKFRLRKLVESSATVYRVSPTGQTFEMRVQDGQCYGGTVGCLLTFAGDDTGVSSTYYVATAGGIKQPAISLAAGYEELISGPASHLVIAHPDFINTAGQTLEQYAADLAGIYGSSDIVNIEAIYAQYSGHVVDAEAIHAYIQDAYAQRGTRQVTLVGGDMYDYRGNLQTQAKSFVPSLYVQIALNVNAVPSDAKYGDIDDDNIPDIEVTRLPVRTEGELATLLAKRDSYIGRSYAQDAVFAADATDGSGYVFKNDAEEFTQHFAAWDIDRAYIDDIGAPSARQLLIDEINAGVSLTSYVGHSHTDRWSFDDLLSGEDIAALSNTNRPTVVTQWGCWNAFYVSPEEDSMAHRFLLEGNNGAVVVMGATSLASASAEKAMANLLYSRLAQGMRLGAAILSAKQAFAQSNPFQYDILLGWTILGPADLVVN